MRVGSLVTHNESTTNTAGKGTRVSQCQTEPTFWEETIQMFPGFSRKLVSAVHDG